MGDKSAVPSNFSVVDNPDAPPHFGGPIEIDFDAKVLKIRWLGEDEWQEISWWEILMLCGEPRSDIREFMSELRSEAREIGYREGIEALKEESHGR